MQGVPTALYDHLRNLVHCWCMFATCQLMRADRSVPVVARPVEGVPLRTAQGAEIPVATVEAAWPADGNGRVYRRRRYDPYLDDPYYDPCATLSIELCPRSAQVAHQPAR